MRALLNKLTGRAPASEAPNNGGDPLRHPLSQRPQSRTQHAPLPAKLPEASSLPSRSIPASSSSPMAKSNPLAIGLPKARDQRLPQEGERYAASFWVGGESVIDRAERPEQLRERGAEVLVGTSHTSSGTVSESISSDGSEADDGPVEVCRLLVNSLVDKSQQLRHDGESDGGAQEDDLLFVLEVNDGGSSEPNVSSLSDQISRSFGSTASERGARQDTDTSDEGSDDEASNLDGILEYSGSDDNFDMFASSSSSDEASVTRSRESGDDASRKPSWRKPAAAAKTTPGLFAPASTAQPAHGPLARGSHARGPLAREALRHSSYADGRRHGVSYSASPDDCLAQTFGGLGGSEAAFRFEQ